eukprot:393575_1
MALYIVTVAIFYSFFQSIQSDCHHVEITADATIMTNNIKLVRQNIKHSYKDKLEDIYTGIYASKRLLQIDACDNIHLLSLKNNAFSMLFSSPMLELKEKHSNIPSDIKTLNQKHLNHIYRSIGFLYYSGHGFLKFTKASTCTATLITSKHILTSAHCLLHHNKDGKVHSLDLKNFKFYPAANS